MTGNRNSINDAEEKEAEGGRSSRPCISKRGRFLLGKGCPPGRLPSGIVSVVQTPFDSLGAVEEASLERLVEDAVEAGVDGLLTPVVASEVACLSEAEREQVVRRVALTLDGRVPLVVGASASQAETCQRMVRLAEAVGAEAYLVAVPAELYDNPAGLTAFFQRIGAMSRLPLIIQDLQWNGPGLTIEALTRLRDVLPTLAGVKVETVPAGPKYTAVREVFGSDFYIAGGWAVMQMIEALDRGVDAMIPESSMVRVYAAIAQQHAAGHRERARALFDKLVPILAFTNQEIATSVAFFKRLLVRKGIFSHAAQRLPGFVWDRYNRRVAEELIERYLTLEKITKRIALIGLLAVACGARVVLGEGASIYRRFTVIEKEGVVIGTEPLPVAEAPRWAKAVSQAAQPWAKPSHDKPLFAVPVPFVKPPAEGSGEPFYTHNHCPALTWCDNGDLLAIWFSTTREEGHDMTILASRLRAGRRDWDPASEFFKTEKRNMTGSGLFRDRTGKLYHFNGVGMEGARGWDRLAMLLRTSKDNGMTWTAARPVSSGANYQARHQPVAGGFETEKGWLIQLCDAVPGHEGGSALHVSRDKGLTWGDAGGDIRGIHAGAVELRDGRLLALGRSQAIDGRMPLSLSADSGKTWTYQGSPFPPIRDGQRLALVRLREGPILLASFTGRGKFDGRQIVVEAATEVSKGDSMEFIGADGKAFRGVGLFAALSFDEGETWPVRKLLTPGSGEWDGGAWTKKFTATPARAEHAGYLAATQTPDGMIHLISSRLYYKFNLAWLKTPAPSK